MYMYYLLVLLIFIIILLQIFSESLLCSGDVDNIVLANQIIMPTPTSSVHPVPSADRGSSFKSSVIKGFDYMLPFDVSVAVVLTAAKEYINSATSPQDKEIELAK